MQKLPTFSQYVDFDGKIAVFSYPIRFHSWSIWGPGIFWDAPEMKGCKNGARPYSMELVVQKNRPQTGEFCFGDR